MFTSRRKTLNNNLAAASRLKGFPDIEKVKEAFSGESIDLSRRPERVSPSEWVAVANRIAAG
jgi:16S rRNA A1518/A1519 N6-dimethyltransferase RsmA/KsgA/DIM1 with predicted DNA glycosylase/AP lyase activity